MKKLFNPTVRRLRTVPAPAKGCTPRGAYFSENEAAAPGRISCYLPVLRLGSAPPGIVGSRALAVGAAMAQPPSEGMRNSVSTPSCGRCSRNPVNPSGHVRLIGETSFGGDPAQAVRTSCDAKPSLAGSQFSAHHRWSHAVNGSKSSGYRLSCQAICFSPFTDWQRGIAGQFRQQQVGPVIPLTR